MYVIVVTLVVVTAPPVTVARPGPVFTEATVGELLLQLPVGVTSLKVVVKPAHMVVLPVIAKGCGFTITLAVAVQPVVSE